jgi:MYXO-CTERM domain-containing protein
MKIKGYALALVLALGTPALVEAQSQAPDTRPTAQERDNDFDWGWLGLLGLAGLFGLKRHEDAHANDRVATAHR